MKVPVYADRLNRILEGVTVRRGAPLRLLVTGSRKAEPGVWGDAVSAVLYTARMVIHRRRWAGGILVHGGAAKGIDDYAHRRFPAYGFVEEVHGIPAEDWQLLGLRAGPIRNQRMVDSKPHVVVGFVAHPGSKGTRGCLAAAERAGIPTLRITTECLELPHVEPYNAML